MCGELVEETKVEESLQILSWKKLRNEVASETGEGELRRTGGGDVKEVCQAKARAF